MSIALALILGLGAPGPLLQDEAKPPAQEPAPAPAPQEPAPGDAHPFFDFDHLEAAPRIGLISFSEDFEADPELSFGIYARAPLPWLSRDLFGLATDEFGGFLEFTLSSIDREVDPPLDEPDGTLFFVTAGLDFNLYRDQTVMAQAQLGLQFGHFGGVTDTDDGVAILIGVLGGLEVAEGVSITLNPQAGLSDAGDHVFFVHLGVQFAF